jgi:uncharacterized membrane protein YgaE (UPF0421/DUF939 family)
MTGATNAAESAYHSGRLITTSVTGQVPILFNNVFITSKYKIKRGEEKGKREGGKRRGREKKERKKKGGEKEKIPYTSYHHIL